MMWTTMAAGVPTSLKQVTTLGLALALLAGACAPAATSPAAPSAAARSATAAPAVTSAPAPTGPPVTLAIGVASNVLYAPLYVGVDKGIYLKHGIDLKLTTVTGGTDAVKGLQSGQYQFTGTTWATILPLAIQGFGFTLFASIIGGPNVGHYDNQLALMARPGLTATGVADLKGMTIATSFGSSPEQWIRGRLTAVGLKPDTDVKLVNVPTPNMLSVLQTKAADVGVTAEPYGVQILAQVPGTRVLVRGGGAADVRVSLLGSSSWVAQNPKVIDQIVAAHLESSQYVRQHPDEAVTATSRYFSTLDRSLLAAALKLIDFDPRWSDKVQQSFEQSSKDLQANGTIKTTPPPATQFLDLARLTTQAKTYPQYFSDLK